MESAKLFILFLIVRYCESNWVQGYLDFVAVFVMCQARLIKAIFNIYINKLAQHDVKLLRYLITILKIQSTNPMCKNVNVKVNEKRNIKALF